jgi:hypothetical protein
MTPYISGSLAQPDTLFERRPGHGGKYKGKVFVVGE